MGLHSFGEERILKERNFLEHVKYAFTCFLIYFNKKPIQDKVRIFFTFTDDEVEDLFKITVIKYE